ncbi:MAG: hypothetical protein ACM3WS_07080, partial [Bacillota bacterium]
PGQLRSFIDLLGKSGSDFDREYTDIITQLQSEAAALASGQSQGATDSGLGRFWQDLLSTLNDELARATRS